MNHCKKFLKLTLALNVGPFPSQIINSVDKPNYLVVPPPTQHLSFLKKLPPYSPTSQLGPWPP